MQKRKVVVLFVYCSMKSFAMLAMLLVSTATLAQSSKYATGIEAFGSRDFQTTISSLTPYADQGDCFAEYAVGFAYWNQKGDAKKDSLAESYLRKAAEHKQTHAMGILATIMIMRSLNEPDIRPEALMWAELAAAYDPIQAETTTRSIIRSYLEAFEISRAEKLIAEKKKLFDSMAPCTPRIKD